jgi:lactate dehydrogenase-like 2-hydroxyacid dehydrogenase
MPDDMIDVLLVGPPKATIVNGLAGFTVHRLAAAKDPAALVAEIAPRVRAIAVSLISEKVDSALMAALPRLEIVSTFGVGYDHIDFAWAAAHGVTVTNTPDVLTEEVADLTLGLLIATVREIPQSDRYLRAGHWPTRGNYPLTRGTMRDRTVGMVGMGRIGQAIARRIEAMGVPVVYHSRRPAPGVAQRHYPKLLDMARDVDTLVVITPGGDGTRNLINADVLAALGPNGVLINTARGSVVDEPALIKALQDKTILSAGLDVYPHEPEVAAELIALDNVVLLPHAGSASVYTRTQMDQLVADNIVAWAAGKPPITPVPETPSPLTPSHDWDGRRRARGRVSLRPSAVRGLLGVRSPDAVQNRHVSHVCSGRRRRLRAVGACDGPREGHGGCVGDLQRPAGQALRRDIRRHAGPKWFQGGSRTRVRHGVSADEGRDGLEARG